MKGQAVCPVSGQLNLGEWWGMRMEVTGSNLGVRIWVRGAVQGRDADEAVVSMEMYDSVRPG